MFKKILIANRGEIACRVMRTAKRLGIATVAVYSDADAGAMHVAMADEAYHIGPPPVAESYLKADRIIAAAKASGAEAIHPGYGFLSENPNFVEAVQAAGLVFIGPSPASIRAMGLKDAAKALMEKSSVPVVPGYHGDSQDADFLAERAAHIGYPVLIKARAGGGGKGMRRVDDPKQFKAALEGAQREGQASFGDSRCLIEKYITKPRHIEIQVFGDNHGNVVHLFERDCSLQRRHQKVIEEAPAPGMTPEMRSIMGATAVKAAEAINYSGAGTIEFIADVSEGLRPDRFYFMEMNTRLQVEHPVTESITGQDLVEWQLRVASGERLPKTQDELSISGWAFEARLYAEDAAKGFLPATGTLKYLALPDHLARIDSGVRQGDEITPFYDPMIAKVIVHGGSRDEALRKLSLALAESRVVGSVTNAAFLGALAANADFAHGDVDTGLIDRNVAALTAEAEPTRVAVAFAGIAALDLLSAKGGTDPWSELRGWRLWAGAPLHVAVTSGGKTHELSITALEHHGFAIDDATGRLALRNVRLAGDKVTADCEGQIVAAHVVTLGHRMTVFMGGQTFAFEASELGGEGEESEAGGDSIMSPLPGLVHRVSAKAGAKVARGEPLVIVEAMKMEHTLTAPRDGVIAEVYVSEGERVQDGTLLLSLEPENG